MNFLFLQKFFFITAFLCIGGHSTLFSQNLSTHFKDSINACVQKSLKYFEYKNGNIELQSAVVLHFLNQKYNLQLTNFSYANCKKQRQLTISDSTALHAEIYTAELLLKIVDKNAPMYKIGSIFFEPYTPTQQNVNEGIMAVMSRSAYCNILPLPPNFMEEINRQIALGEYYLTHSAMAFKWAMDNNCLNLSKKKICNLRCNLIFKLCQTAQNPSLQSLDLIAEAMCALYVLEAKSYVNAAWVRLIMQKQLPNGGWQWGLNTKSLESYDHTAVLCLWALLETAYPNVPYKSMIKN